MTKRNCNEINQQLSKCRLINLQVNLQNNPQKFKKQKNHTQRICFASPSVNRRGLFFCSRVGRWEYRLKGAISSLNLILLYSCLQFLFFLFLLFVALTSEHIPYIVHSQFLVAFLSEFVFVIIPSLFLIGKFKTELF